MNSRCFRVISELSRFVNVILCCLVLAGCATDDSHLAATDNDTVLLFASFRGNGQDGLHLAVSEDGLNWQALRQDQSFLTPKVGTKLMRDPVIIQGPDQQFHMVWTSGWEDAGIGIAHSSNLKDWSEQQFLPVMADFPEARNAWAPEIFYDETTQRYWIYWASTLPGKYPDTEKQADKGWDHRIYATSTKDFKTYSPTRLFYEPGFNVIDSTLIQQGNEYVMIAKDETRYPPAKNLFITRASSLEGPWQKRLAAFTPSGVWAEGPAAVFWRGWYYVYYDQYIDHSFGVMRTRNFTDWENLTPQLTMPPGTRHGSVLVVPRSLVGSL